MPHTTEALHLRGILALQQEDFHVAIDWLSRALALGPPQAAMYSNRGIAWQRLGQLQQAIADYDQAIALDPALHLAHANRAVACMDCGQTTTALASFAHALALAPNSAATHSNLGNALMQLAQAHAAQSHYEHAVRLDPDNPNYRLHLGLAHLQLDQYPAASEAFQQALERDPKCAAAHCYLGETQRAQNQLDAAEVCYAHALALEPTHADARFFHALSLLARGEWARGWPLYEWRWRSAAARLLPRDLRRPVWLGQANIRGQRVLVHCEQGLGDTLQFCRYLPLLTQRGAQVVVEAPGALIPLLQTLDGEYQWVSAGTPLPAFDWHCPLLSLPLALGASAPASMPHGAYLHTSQAQQRHWQATLPRRGHRRLGIAWSGNPHHVNDRHRSLLLADLLPYLPADWDVVVLQTELRQADQATLQRHPELHYPGASVHDFSDSAALCQSMDLLLTVDTSLAHLAAALGCPTWLLLPWRADWRWGLHGERTDWYPGMRLYRQPALHDWPSVLTQVQADLLNWQCPEGPARHTKT